MNSQLLQGCSLPLVCANKRIPSLASGRAQSRSSRRSCQEGLQRALCPPCWADRQSWSRQLQPSPHLPARSSVGSLWRKMAGSKRELNAGGRRISHPLSDERSVQQRSGSSSSGRSSAQASSHFVLTWHVWASRDADVCRALSKVVLDQEAVL